MNKKIPLIIFVLLSVLYISFGYGVTVSNDSVTNIDQITALDLMNRSSHFGFHLLGIIFYLVFSKLIGLSAVTSVEIMLAVFSAAGSAALYMITLKKFNDVKLSLLTVLLYAFTSGVFRFSCQIEYLVLIPSLGLISLYFYTEGKNFIAGVIFGLGLLTSVVLILISPLFLLFTSLKDLLKKQNIIFAFTSIAVFFAVNLFTFQKTVSGDWSYGDELMAYIKTSGDFNFLRPVAILIYGYLRSFNIIILLLPFTLFYLFKNNKQLFYICIVTLIIHLPFAIPEARYGGYQMTAYPVLAVASAFFLLKTIKSQKLVVTIVLIFISLNTFVVYSERAFNRDLRDTYVKLNNDLKNKSVLIVYQATKPIKKIYAPDLQTYDLLSDYLNKMAEKRYSDFKPLDLNDVLEKNDAIYVLESGVSMPDDNIKLFFSSFTKNQGAKVKGFALDKILSLNPSLNVEKLKNYPLDIYKISKAH